MISNPEIFYRSYQVNYYDYVQITLNEALLNVENSKLDKVIHGYSIDDHKRGLKTLIRQTLFHAIETVFELVYALKLNPKGYTEDYYMLRKLSVSRVTNETINKVAKDINELFFLDTEVKADKFKISLGHYIFYCGLYNTHLDSRIKESLLAIRQVLHILAKEMDNRYEYNSLKHSIRVMPLMKKFMIHAPEDEKKKVEWDLSDSYTFYSESKKSGEIEIRTKTFDTERDIKLTSLCSNIIWNIVTFRRAGIYRDMEEIPICFFDEDFIMEANKFNASKLDFKFNTKYK